MDTMLKFSIMAFCLIAFKASAWIDRHLDRLIIVLIIALSALAFSGCASTSKDAKDWKTKVSAPGPKGMELAVNTTTGKTECTIFYLHGLADGVKAPKESIYESNDLVKKFEEIGCSRVVNLSYGMAWMLRPEGDGLESVNEYVAHIQKLNLPKPWIGVGLSMGGANLATICMKSKIFARCVLLNPMIMRADQWSDKFLDFSRPLGEIDASLMPGNHFSKDEWARYNLWAITANQEVPIWVTACPDDMFKLYPATAAWVEYAQKAGLAVEFFPNTKGCEHSAPLTTF